jgi:hypothetical protein
VLNPPIPSKVSAAIKATKRRAAVVSGARLLWPPLMVFFGLGAAGAVLSGLPAALLSIISGIGLALGAFLLFRAVVAFKPIDDLAAQRLVEHAAGATEIAPLTSKDDRPIGGGDADLWAWHVQQRDKAIQALSKPVNPGFTRKDGLRGIALLLAGIICLWQPVAAARMLSFDLSPLVGDGDLVVDAWAVPPEYTNLPVIRLDRATHEVSLPEGSIIHARMDGAKGAPRLVVAGKSVTMTRTNGQAWTAQIPINRSGLISLNRFGARASWQAQVIQDQAPVFTKSVPITIDPKGRLDVSFSAKDDYSITSAALRTTVINPPDSLGQKTTVETPLTLEDSGDAQGEGEGARRLFVDVTQHVFTGLEVDVVLVLRDGRGQETRSPATRLTLPAVKWTTSLGAALQEQRLLILRESRPYRRVPPAYATLFDQASGEPIVLDLTEGLNGAPENIVRAQAMLRATLNSLRDNGLSDVATMGLQFASERLALARDLSGAQEVAPLLWEIALQSEQSDKTPGQQRLDAARQALEQALKNGASEDQIRELSQDLREAVAQRLEELAQQGGQDGGEGTGGQGGNSVSANDIDKMLSDLERSGQSGARQDALDQLAQLGELMDNLESGQQGSGDGSGQGQGQGQGANPLDDAMRAQRDLSDETAQRQNEEQGGQASDLAQRQEALADQLSPPGRPAPAPNGPEGQVEAGKQQAAQAMREAARALREGDLSAAQQAQSAAEQALQQAAQAQNANNGTGDGNQDPLGRRIVGPDDGRGTKVPQEAEKRRARDVREELRRRQADPNRDGQERDYLDRLLKDR